MNETEVLNEFFIWEENNLTEPKMKSVNNGVNEHKDIMNETKTDLTPNDWRDITDPKLRKKMRLKEKNKRYREKYKDKIKLKKQVNKDKAKSYRRVYDEINKDRLKAQRKAYNETNRDKQKAYREANKEKIKIRSKAYREVNKNKIKTYNEVNRDKINSYKRNRFKTDIQYKLSCNLRNRLYDSIKNNQKAGSAVKDLGCTIEELKSYLESKFQPGMTWDNWSIDGWHIDHIKPLMSFDLNDRKQFLEACHYTNLQPLWSTDNLSKGDKLI